MYGFHNTSKTKQRTAGHRQVWPTNNFALMGETEPERLFISYRMEEFEPIIKNISQLIDRTDEQKEFLFRICVSLESGKRNIMFPKHLICVIKN